MICGAISRSAAQTIMHPANTMKTILQSSRSVPGKVPLTIKSFAKWENARHLTRGAGAQLVLSVPHGAVNFAVLEFVRRQMNNLVSLSPYAATINRSFGPGMDFISSAISTVCCSVVSTPQMMICDNIMAGTYGNLVEATKGLMKDKGVKGFYGGWWPGIAGKIPSYGLTWTLFEQIKRVRSSLYPNTPAKDIENSIMGCLASATTVCIMIPMDTVKTRLVTQLNYPDLTPYNGISDCFKRVLKEEGIGAFYRGLTPRLLSVVPMIGIQFGVYEATKKIMLARETKESISPKQRLSKADRKKLDEEKENERSRRERLMEEMAMEVAADDDQPYPAPYRKRDWWGMAVQQLKKEKQPCGVSKIAR
jgi:solute carrier family 25 S-adenosylmethionine transporter 26